MCHAVRLRLRRRAKFQPDDVMPYQQLIGPIQAMRAFKPIPLTLQECAIARHIGQPIGPFGVGNVEVMTGDMPFWVGQHPIHRGAPPDAAPGLVERDRERPAFFERVIFEDS